MKTLLKSIIISAFFLSCQPSIKKENRLNTTFNFNQILYTYFDSSEYGGLLPHYGSVIINDSKIKISVNANDAQVVDSFVINKVTYDENKTEYKYQTNAGEFIVEMNDSQVKGIRHLSSTAIAQFYQEINNKKNTIKSNNQIYYEFDSPMLIDEEHIKFAQEIGSTYYTEHNYFYGVITAVDKNFDSFKIKISKTNQNSIDALGHDITGLEWNVTMDKVNYLDNNEMCEICASDFQNLIVKGGKLKFAMVEGCPDCGTSMNGVWFLTYAKEFNDK